MEEIFIIYEYSKISGRYGVGTFIKQLSDCLRLFNSVVNIIEVSREDIYEFEIEFKNGINYIRIPHLLKCEYKNISKLLYLHLLTGGKVCFVLNNKEHYEFIADVKLRITYMKIIYVIHYFSWMWLVKGNITSFIKHIKHMGNNESSRAIYETFRCEQKIAEFSDMIVCLSNDSYDLLKNTYKINSSKLRMIQNSLSDKYTINSDNQRHQLRYIMNFNEYEKIILYVGRIDTMKGVDTLVLAFNKVIKLFDNCRLVIVGEGNFSLVSPFINRAASKIIFTGGISRMQVEKWYQIADVGILPTLSEECSFVGIEMMMHGLPIVASNGRGVRNMFHHMQNCLSVDCQSGQKIFEKELSEAILKILNSEELANNLRKKSRQWYLDNYQLKFMQKKYLSLLKDITK